MKKRRQRDDSDSGGGKNWILITLILLGLGYLAYTHQEEIKAFDLDATLKSFKQLVGLEKPEPEPAAAQPTLPPPPPSTFTTTPPTNATATPAVPVVGRLRPVLPAHEHWTWTTSDGKTYQDVKVEKIEGDTVTIIHSSGGASLPLSSLPADVQQELNYYSAQAQQQ